MDAFRKQLDALMGANRNGDVQEVKRKYYARDVCRYFLCGLCPHDLFQNTKIDLGPCGKVHSLHLRLEYEDAKKRLRDNYDRELEECLEKHIIDCDKKIQRALKRLEDTDEGAASAVPVSQATKTPESNELTKQIKDKLRDAEKLDLEGKTDEKLKVLEVVEELRQKRADKQALALLETFNKDRATGPLGSAMLGSPPGVGPSPIPPDPRTQEAIRERLKKAEELGEMGMVDEAQKAMEEAEALKRLGSRGDPADGQKGDMRIADQKLRVCDVCGAFLSIYDSDRRLADHFGGKLHLGYFQIREKLQEIREERLKPRKTEEDDERSKDSDPGLDKDVKERDKSLDRDRPARDRSSERNDRDRDRDRDADRHRIRERDRDRDRGRDYDRSGRRRERDRRRDRYGRY
ncbi:hypothetical protein CBR_g36466 [Chara braunii]|uniref:Uncharacterized protein n=1 Tax=Chara braunii TaxID=69332 RepID=A0A388LKU4_CHABU|nr:hypothetical protein CBR_g36466 [Chara braunii]|eukprot:GBG82939.1 hypothetical protein CBR_g36466 [Chara braunii]